MEIKADGVAGRAIPRTDKRRFALVCRVLIDSYLAYVKDRE
jgi:hypothetical protein